MDTSLADGAICSGGNSRFSQLDNPKTPSGGAWPTTKAYQYHGRCSSVAHAKPHSIYGEPQLVDVDAIHIPSGTTYWGAYSGIPKKWTHTGNGWWKFSKATDVHIDWTS